MTRRARNCLLASASLLLLPFLSAKAQEEEGDFGKNVIYVEAAGNGLFFGSLNYERMLGPRLSARLGISPIGSVPVMLNFLPGQGPHSLEIGAGTLIGHGGAIGTATFGYRYQPRERGFVFRAGLTPFLDLEDVVMWGGVSVGFLFEPQRKSSPS